MKPKKTRASAQSIKAPKARPARYKLNPEDLRMNEKRAAWARKSIALFRKLTGAEPDTAVRDLLQGLMHLCDRDLRLGDFDDELDWAFHHYATFTAAHIEEEIAKKTQ